MTVFESLIVAHILGDWIFQTEWMAVNKIKKALPLIVHVFIYHIFIWIALGYQYGYANIKVYAVLLILMIIHALLDVKWTVDGFMRFMRINVNREPNIVLQLSIDQSLHIILLAAAVIYFQYC